MAIAPVQTIGPVGSITSVTSLSLTIPAGGVSVGSLVIVRWANYQGASTPTISDTRGNTWHLDVALNTTNDGDNDIWSSVLTTALLAGDTITVGTTASQQDYILAADVFTGVDGYLAKGTTATGNSLSPSATIASQPVPVLLYGFIQLSNSTTTTWTADSDSTGGDTWHVLPWVNSKATGAQAESLYAAYKIPTTAAAQTFNPTYTGSVHSWVTAVVAYSGSTTASVTSSGSLSLNGSTTVTALSSVTASGSIALSGSATATTVPSRTASGALSLSGSTTVTALPVRTASGALSLGGSPTATAVPTVTTSGGLTLGGSTTVTAVAARTASGSLALSGSTTVTALANVTASGSLSLGGTATAAAVPSVTASGGLTLTGSAVATAGATATATGSLGLGGATSTTALATESVSGTLGLNGSAHVDNLAEATTEGSLALSGSTSVASLPSVTASGSLHLGGSTHMMGFLLLRDIDMTATIAYDWPVGEPALTWATMPPFGDPITAGAPVILSTVTAGSAVGNAITALPAYAKLITAATPQPGSWSAGAPYIEE